MISSFSDVHDLIKDLNVKYKNDKKKLNLLSEAKQFANYQEKYYNSIPDNIKTKNTLQSILTKVEKKINNIETVGSELILNQIPSSPSDYSNDYYDVAYYTKNSQNANNSTLEKKVNDLTKEKDEELDNLKKCDEEKATLEKKVNDLTKEKDEALDNLKKCDEEKTTLEKKVNDLTKEKDEALDNLKKCNKENILLKQKQQDYGKAFKLLKEKINNIANNEDDYKSIVDLAIKEIESKNRFLNEERMLYSIGLRELEQLIDISDKNLKEKVLRVNTVGGADEDINQISERIKQKIENMNKLIEKIDLKDDILNDYKNKNEALTTENDQLKLELQGILVIVENIKSKLDTMYNNIINPPKNIVTGGTNVEEIKKELGYCIEKISHIKRAISNRISKGEGRFMKYDDELNNNIIMPMVNLMKSFYNKSNISQNPTYQFIHGEIKILLQDILKNVSTEDMSEIHSNKINKIKDIIQDILNNVKTQGGDNNSCIIS